MSYFINDMDYPSQPDIIEENHRTQRLRKKRKALFEVSTNWISSEDRFSVEERDRLYSYADARYFFAQNR